MKTLTTEEGDIIVERTGGKGVILNTGVGNGYTYLKPLEAVELAKLLLTEAGGCLDFPEFHAVTEDMRRFIEGGPVEP